MEKDIEDNEVGLPQKGLNMIIKETIPEVRVANDARELFSACCVEFVRHVATEAQRISGNDQRKTIYHQHVTMALRNLEFPQDYSDAADSVLNDCKEAAEKRLKRKNSRLDKCGIPEEQLYEMQQRLIQQAREDQEAAETQRLQKEQEAQRGGQLPAAAPVFAVPETGEKDDEYDT